MKVTLDRLVSKAKMKHTVYQALEVQNKKEETSVKIMLTVRLL